MKKFTLFSVIVMLASALLTWNAIALPMTKIHMLENLTPEESILAEKIIGKKGYLLSHQPLFKESHEALMITKVIATEIEPASFQIEVVHQDDSRSIPKSVFKSPKLETTDISEALNKLLPTPDKLKHTLVHPVDESTPFAEN